MYPLVMKYILLAGMLNLVQPQLKLSNVWDMNVLVKYLERLGDNALLTYSILTKKLIVLKFRLTTICMSTVKKMTLNNM